MPRSLPRPHRLGPSRDGPALPSTGDVAAVYAQDRAGDAGRLRRGQEHDRAGDLVGCQHAPDRMVAQGDGQGRRGVRVFRPGFRREVGVHRPGRDRVDPYPAPGVLDGELSVNCTIAPLVIAYTLWFG